MIAKSEGCIPIAHRANKPLFSVLKSLEILHIYQWFSIQKIDGKSLHLLMIFQYGNFVQVYFCFYISVIILFWIYLNMSSHDCFYLFLNMFFAHGYLYMFVFVFICPVLPSFVCFCPVLSCFCLFV
jgi:hypothetical protein